jgi:S1-C subfamily serine protease
MRVPTATARAIPEVLMPRVLVHPFALTMLSALLAAQNPAPTTPATPPSPPPTAKSLGITFAEWSSKLRRALVRTTTPYGFAVRAVAKDSPAAAAGLRRGVVVLEVDGKPLQQLADLDNALRAAKPGQTLRLTCARRRANRKLLDRQPWETMTIELVVPAVAR